MIFMALPKHIGVNKSLKGLIYPVIKLAQGINGLPKHGGVNKSARGQACPDYV